MVSDKQTAVRNTACSSCGALVPIYSRASVQAVCPFCRSTLIRTDLQWETIGQMAALAEDLSPLYVGLRGKYNQTSFIIIGRIQQQYAEGIWNEWLLQLDNRRGAWLGEGSGLFYLTIPTTTTETLPAFTSLYLGQNLILGGKHYTVSNIENARCIATDGEIPFAADPGHSANLVDLTGENGSFASLDYSDEQVKLYTGKALYLNELQFESIDTKALQQQPSKDLRCAGCGNAVTIQNPASLVVACASCSMVNNISAGGKLVVAFNQTQQKLRPAIALGSHGILAGHSYEMIGFMRRSADGDTWDEYLLYNPSQGTRWLVCAEGHWTFIKTCPAPSLATALQRNSVFHKARRYQHFSTYGARVQSVLGEFYWRVTGGEKSDCSDYICPPYIVSCEKSDKEILWSEGCYIDAADIAQAFDIEKTSTSGIGINQPSPAISGYLTTYLISIALTVLICIIFNLQSQHIHVGRLELTKQDKTAKLASEPFTLKSAHGSFQIQTNTNVSNDWANFEYALVNQDTGETRLMNREIAYYSGHDSEGGWSEGSNNDLAVLDKVTAGRYVVEVSAETDNATVENLRPMISADISATHGRGSTGNTWLLLLGLGVFPLLAGLHKYSFEKKRWDASDHPWESAD
jgi:ribosomal protein S27E